jgi:hypothetical protein
MREKGSGESACSSTASKLKGPSICSHPNFKIRGGGVGKVSEIGLHLYFIGEKRLELDTEDGINIKCS